MVRLLNWGLNRRLAPKTIITTLFLIVFTLSVTIATNQRGLAHGLSNFPKLPSGITWSVNNENGLTNGFATIPESHPELPAFLAQLK